MTITPIQNVWFDDAATSAMGEAFDRACASLQHFGSAPAIIADRIIAVAKNGERDPARLYEQALIFFGIDVASMPVVSVGRDPCPFSLRFDHARSVILREHGYPRSCALGPSGCVFKLSSPRHLRCQIPRQTKPGFFIRERRPLLAQSRHSHCNRECHFWR